uniref:Uncharacterized protein n=1 Tax=Nicotiana tabacum TaxID=4097 RepID=A0A1S4A2J5_TOBAC|nr:PREDICTED: uncharacterized protein LOC107793135 [Nicotiana tabacum]
MLLCRIILKKKEELLASQSAYVDGETNLASEQSQLSEMDIWVLSVGGKKNGRVAGLGSLGRSVKVPKQTIFDVSEEVDDRIRAQVHALNAELYNQLEETQRQNKEMRRQNKKMRHQNKKMRKELGDTNEKLAALIKHVGYPTSSSNAQSSSSEDNQDSQSDNDDNNNSVDQYDLD